MSSGGVSMLGASLRCSVGAAPLEADCVGGDAEAESCSLVLSHVRRSVVSVLGTCKGSQKLYDVCFHCIP